MTWTRFFDLPDLVYNAAVMMPKRADGSGFLIGINGPELGRPLRTAGII